MTDAATKEKEPIRDLVLGWEVDSGKNPSYWMDPSATPGGQEPTDLVTVQAKNMASHAVIVAQSGSGKSFFLGRLLEELILKTRGRIVVLDPNADFRRIRDVAEGIDKEGKATDLWKTAKYDRKQSKGKLPHEKTREEFESKWKEMDLEVLSGPFSPPKNTRRLLVPWDVFQIAFISEDLDPIARSQVSQCHEFVKAISTIETIMGNQEVPTSTSAHLEESSLLERSRKLLQRARHEGAKETLDDFFPAAGHDSEKNITPGFPLIDEVSKWVVGYLKSLSKSRLKLARERAISAVEFVSPEIERFYFGRAKEFVAQGIVSDSISEQVNLRHKGVVIDLPSFSLVLKSFHFDGYKHYGRRVDAARIIDRLGTLREGVSVATGYTIEDESGNHDRLDSQAYDDCQLLQLTDILVGGFRTVLGQSTHDAQWHVSIPLLRLAEKWNDGYARMKQSRWFGGFCISECWLENGQWMFTDILPESLQLTLSGF
jgi:hypothetical protein